MQLFSAEFDYSATTKRLISAHYKGFYSGA